jgi:hypothetical protein
MVRFVRAANNNDELTICRFYWATPTADLFEPNYRIQCVRVSRFWMAR